jgi:ActR/RegA family two-component response regulator
MSVPPSPVAAAGPVLIVDDDMVTRRLVAGALAARGITDIDEVGSLAEAGNAISSRAYAGAVIDLHLPDGNGMEFVHMVRRGLASLSRGMVVVVSSAYVSERTSRLLLRLGATEVMRKPPDVERIAALLKVADAA